MSMAMALEYTAEWLMEKNSWTNNQVGVQPDAIPPNTAGPWYVAIDDSGVETGEDATDALKEILTITIGIWRRSEHLQNDRKGILKLVKDKYLLGAWTLHRLERTILIHKSGAEIKNGLHNNYSFLTGLNLRFNLPNEADGAEFRMPWNYKGRGRMETIGLADEQAIHAFYGYRLRFRGLMRLQKLRRTEDAIG